MCVCVCVYIYMFSSQDCLLWINTAKAKDKIYMGCRCYERLQPNTKEFTRLAYTESSICFCCFFLERNKKKEEKKAHWCPLSPPARQVRPCRERRGTMRRRLQTRCRPRVLPVLLGDLHRPRRSPSSVALRLPKAMLDVQKGPLRTFLSMTSIPTSQLQTSNRVCWAFFPSLELSYASPASQVFLFLLHWPGFLDSVNTFGARMGHGVT